MNNKRDWLIQLRNQVGKTQQEVVNGAKELKSDADISRSTYAQYESGRRSPSVENAQLLGQVIGFDWTIFFAQPSCGKQQKKSA